MNNNSQDREKQESTTSQLQEKKEAIMNLANNMIKNENTFDMGSIMKMATTLLKDETLMNSVKDLGGLKQSTPIKFAAKNLPKALPASFRSDKTENNDVIRLELPNPLADIRAEVTNQFNELQDQLAGMLSNLQAELAAVKEQNAKLLEYITNLEKK
jgi:hypothetical protein